MKYILKWGLTFLFIEVCLSSVYAQQKIDTALEQKLIQLYTWKYRVIPGKGILMFVDFPYNLSHPSHFQSQYLSVSVGLRPNEKQAAFISFTLSDDMMASKGILIGFDSLPVPMPAAQFSLKKLNSVYNIKFYKHWENNHTNEFVIPNGRINDTTARQQIDIFGEFMHYRHLYVLFYDSLGLKTMYFPLFFFQKRYEELSAPPPAYSTGNPADTALTAEERSDKMVFDDGATSPTTWEIAGISDPIRLKQFIKYFRYLMNHDEKEKMAQFITYPQNYLMVACKDSADFVHNYYQIFDADLKRVINDQKLDQLFRNIHGMWIGWAPCVQIRQHINRYEIFSIANNAEAKEAEKANAQIDEKRKAQGNKPVKQ